MGLSSALYPPLPLPLSSDITGQNSNFLWNISLTANRKKNMIRGSGQSLQKRGGRGWGEEGSTNRQDLHLRSIFALQPLPMSACPQNLEWSTR